MGVGLGVAEQSHLVDRSVCLPRENKNLKKMFFPSFSTLEISVREVTWFPPLFGLTNTSSGFMSCEGRGLTRKGFQRPSWT